MPAAGHQHYDLREVEHAWIPMADGTRLAARLWLPVTPDGRATPAILEYIPYRKRDLSRSRDERNHRYFAQRGYASLRVDMRGSGDSEGVMRDMYGPDELDDAIAVIDWIARQAWCDGTVGMMGTSWGGTSSLQVAARRPNALKAVIAVCATDNRFDDDIHHMGGCLLTDTVEWGATLPAILAAPPDPQSVGPDCRRIWQTRLEGLSFPLENWIRHETRDAYWRRGAVSETPDAIACPVLAIGGWADRYSNTVMNLLARSPDRCWGIVGPWGHHYPDQASPGPGIGFQQEAVRWWDRWLKGEANGVEREPRLRVWMQAYQTPRDKIETRAGRWISEPSWPSKSIAAQDHWFAPGRLQGMPAGEPETREIPWNLAVGGAAGDSGYFGRDGGLPTDQQEDDDLSLIFETAPLEAPLEILGPSRLAVSLTSDQPVATLVARLNDVPPSGEVARVTYAVKNLALDDKGETPNPLASDEMRSFSIDFPNTAYRFDRGHRIRLAVSSSYWPLIWPAPEAARIALGLESARLTLPVRSARSDEATPSFAAPLVAELAEPPLVISAPRLERRTRVDAKTGRRSIRWHQPFKCLRYADIDLEFGFETRAEHAIMLDEPNSAVSRFEHRFHFKRGDWIVEVLGTAELTSTDTTYHPSGSVEVRENGELVLQRRWAPVIPRACS